MAIIKRYDKSFADFLLKHCNDIHIPKYITVSPCGINHEPFLSYGKQNLGLVDALFVIGIGIG